jgi:hypothetical protein
LLVTVLDVAGQSWQNHLNRFDVSADGRVAPLDVLQIVNELNEPKFTIAQTPLPAVRPSTAPFYDVDGNGFITPLDALVIINFLNNGASEGEAQLVVNWIGCFRNATPPVSEENEELGAMDLDRQRDRNDSAILLAGAGLRPRIQRPAAVGMKSCISENDDWDELGLVINEIVEDVLGERRDLSQTNIE